MIQKKFTNLNQQTVVTSDRVNAAFHVDETLGASPFIVDFIDYSTATGSTSITSWEWDFNNDGTIDSNDPNPQWTYIDEQSYTVKLTVNDGVEQHTRILRKLYNCPRIYFRYSCC